LNDILYLARSRATVVWLVLVGATAASWWLGVHDVPGLDSIGGGVGAVVILIAMIKVRFVALHFMEIRDAPRPLRLIIEFYCAAVLAALMVLLLVT
jgi:hypothetical protein